MIKRGTVLMQSAMHVELTLVMCWELSGTAEALEDLDRMANNAQFEPDGFKHDYDNLHGYAISSKRGDDAHTSR